MIVSSALLPAKTIAWALALAKAATLTFRFLLIVMFFSMLTLFQILMLVLISTGFQMLMIFVMLIPPPQCPPPPYPPKLPALAGTGEKAATTATAIAAEINDNGFKLMTHSFERCHTKRERTGAGKNMGKTLTTVASASGTVPSRCMENGWNLARNGT